MRRRLIGVSIGGVPWSVGKHCLYLNGDNRATCLGTVVNMFYGQDDMQDDFVVFQVQNKPITTIMGHYCTYANDSPDMDMVFWDGITWMCKLFAPRGGQSGMALPYASCTSHELMEFS
jgi:hypothetical protein